MSEGEGPFFQSGDPQPAPAGHLFYTRTGEPAPAGRSLSPDSPTPPAKRRGDRYHRATGPLFPCAMCGHEGDVDAFGLDRNDYVRSYCRPCQRAATNEWRNRNREAFNERRRVAARAERAAKRAATATAEVPPAEPATTPRNARNRRTPAPMRSRSDAPA